MAKRALLTLVKSVPRITPETMDCADGWTEAAVDLLRRRFFEPEDRSIKDWAWNVAGSYVRKYSKKSAETWQERYFSLIYYRRFFPTSAALKNGRRRVSTLSGCTVIPVSTSLSELYSKTIPSVMSSLGAGIGVGLDLSHLAPRLAEDKENFRPSPGPVEIMVGIAHLASGIIKYNGLKRAAFMASLRYDHPDIFEFVRMKVSRSLEAVNISIAIDDDFSHAINENDLIPLRYQGMLISATEIQAGKVRAQTRNVMPPDLELLDDGRLTSRTLGGRVVGRELNGSLYILASRVLEAIAEAAHTCGDPGLINLGAINANNPTPDSSNGSLSSIPGTGSMHTTTPCGEQPLLPNEVCHLGSLNLTAFAKKDGFDWDLLAESTAIATRMMDDIIDSGDNGSSDANEISLANRKIGIGIMGLADVLSIYHLPYDSQEGRAFAGRIAEHVNKHAKAASNELAEERGAFPNWKRSVFAKNGQPARRHATVTTIAPTGHIATLAGCSTGIEPYFSLHYIRQAAGARVIVCEQLVQYLLGLEYSLDEWILATRRANPNYTFNGSLDGLISNPTDSSAKNLKLSKAKQIFRTALQISARDHLEMVAALQLHVENGISKTINLPHSASIQEFYQIFVDAIRLSLKGVTAFRDGSLNEQALTISTGCANCGAVMAINRNECRGYICAIEKGGCGFAECEV